MEMLECFPSFSFLKKREAEVVFGYQVAAGDSPVLMLGIRRFHFPADRSFIYYLIAPVFNS